MRTCPSCGLPVVQHHHDDPPLTLIKLRIWRLIKARPGMSAEKLVELVYGDDDGGPDSGRRVIHAHVNQINRYLQSMNSKARIRGNRFWGYRITEK